MEENKEVFEQVFTVDFNNEIMKKKNKEEYDKFMNMLDSCDVVFIDMETGKLIK